MDGSTLYGFNGDSVADCFGGSVSGAGDVNGDGRADLIVGAYGDDNHGDKSGSARVFSGIDGSTLYTFYGHGARDEFGWSVSDAGDVNGDGFADMIVGAYRDDNNGTDSGSARVLTVNGVYDWRGASSDPGNAANWQLMNTSARPDSAPAGRDVIRIGPAARHPVNSGTIDVARIDVLDGGTLQNSSGGSIICPVINVNAGGILTIDTLDNSGTVTADGTIGGTLNNNSGGVLKGSGTVGVLNLNDGSTLAPGNSIGAIGAGDTTFGPGALIELQISDFAGTPGDASVGWDLLSVSGTLTLTATADNPVQFDLLSLTAAQTPGPAENFDAMQSYSLTFVATTGGISGFDADAFVLDAGSLQNDLGGGTFWISQSGNDLQVNFTPIPEPSTLAMAAMAAMGLLGLACYGRRRRRVGGM
ncbi:MAG: FG-GAP repeat protein [Candidatus Nealsonbacteria bacterium]|nr:FG-GAP repeat protein [Candidatus Nealsonbacteria bacterium]